ncbi:MAG: hypothetical protein JW786_00055 [Desulfobacterales bacterium]|nr:hypothetical protein [Desulfobacterales bacterium]
MKKVNDIEWSKVKVGDVLPGFIMDGIPYPSGGVVTKVEGGISEKGLIMEFIIQFTDALYRIYWHTGEKIFSYAKID